MSNPYYTSNAYAKTGAVFYVLWGILHTLAAFLVIEPAAGGLSQGIATARIYQNSVFMAMAGIAAIWIAYQFNWKNDTFGYWFNLFIVAVSDLGFIILVLIPGYEPPPAGLIGPTLWVIALAFSTVGILKKDIMLQRAQA